MAPKILNEYIQAQDQEFSKIRYRWNLITYIYISVSKGIHKLKLKVAFSINMANFEAFHQNKN